MTMLTMMMLIVIFISVAKLLDGGEEGRDWRALGNLLGYKEVPCTCTGDIYFRWGLIILVLRILVLMMILSV